MACGTAMNTRHTHTHNTILLYKTLWDIRMSFNFISCNFLVIVHWCSSVKFVDGNVVSWYQEVGHPSTPILSLPPLLTPCTTTPCKEETTPKPSLPVIKRPVEANPRRSHCPQLYCYCLLTASHAGLEDITEAGESKGGVVETARSSGGA